MQLRDDRPSERGSASGPVLVFLHGFGLSSAMWEPQLAAFRDRCRVVAPDLPGFGGTPGLADHSIDGYADWVAESIEGLGLARVILVGLSMGGYVSFGVLRRHPGIVAAAVLADTRAEADSPEDVERRSRQQTWIEEGGDLETLADWYVGLGVGKASPRAKEAAALFRSSMLETPRSTWVGALEAMKRRPDATGGLADIDVPVLVVVGQDDALTPPSAAEVIARGISGARLEVIPRAGHLSSLEDPEAFNRELEVFLSALP